LVKDRCGRKEEGKEREREREKDFSKALCELKFEYTRLGPWIMKSMARYCNIRKVTRTRTRKYIDVPSFWACWIRLASKCYLV
jgi:hypothetical protein